MPRKPPVSVEPRPDGRWAVQTDGTQRADSLHDRKSDAVSRGRELAGNKRAELVIKNEAGRIARTVAATIRDGSRDKRITWHCDGQSGHVKSYRNARSVRVPILT